MLFTLAAPSTKPVKVEFYVVPRDGRLPNLGFDVNPGYGWITIPAGVTRATLPLKVVGDEIPEPTTAYSVRISWAHGLGAGDDAATLTVIDDDAPGAHPQPRPIVVVTDGARSEGAGPGTMEVRLDHPSAATIVVCYRTDARSALPGSDYVHKDHSLVFHPGEVRHVIRVDLLDDAVPEPQVETFRLNLYWFSGVIPGDTAATFTIIDDD